MYEIIKKQAYIELSGYRCYAGHVKYAILNAYSAGLSWSNVLSIEQHEQLMSELLDYLGLKH